MPYSIKFFLFFLRWARILFNRHNLSNMKDILRKTIPDKLVVLTFDDGCKSQATFVGPLLKSYGFGATFYITEGLNFLTNKEAYMTWEEVKGLHDEGFEIGNHTRHHRNVTQQTAAELSADLVHIDERCETYGISQPTTFCYPVIATARRLFRCLLNTAFILPDAALLQNSLTMGKGGAVPPTTRHCIIRS